MIKKYLTAVVLLAISLLIMSFSEKKITCIIKGKVIGRNSDTIFLMKATEDTRYAQIIIPIKDSIFEYKLIIPQIEAYQLVFKDELDRGAWRPIVIFPENGVINCKLYSTNEFEKNQINGGTLNSEYSKYQKTFKDSFMTKYKPLDDSSKALRKRNEYYSDEVNSLQKEIQSTKDKETIKQISKKIMDLRSGGNDVSPKGRAIKDKIDLLTLEASQWRYKYIEQNPTLLSYYFLFEDLTLNKKLVPVDQINKSYVFISKKYPDHPYTKLIRTILESQESIKIGGSFIDFSAPDLYGKTIKLSEIIKGKVAVIDLWASWCSPCIITSRSMIPVYEEFKDKGFVICGVAAEIKNTDQMKKTIEKEKFPWINLVELDHKHQIWYKYGISNAGGGTFLVDKDGKILSISPTAEELRSILSKKLK